MYEELRDLIKDNRGQFRSDAQLVLAEKIGNNRLRNAINPCDFPPCKISECQKCYLSKWCVHKIVPLPDRTALIDLMDMLTTPSNEISQQTLDVIHKIDKTNPVYRQHLLTYASKLVKEHNALHENPRTDSTNEKSWSSSTNLDGCSSSTNKE